MPSTLYLQARHPPPCCQRTSCSKILHASVSPVAEMTAKDRNGGKGGVCVSLETRGGDDKLATHHHSRNSDRCFRASTEQLGEGNSPDTVSVPRVCTSDGGYVGHLVAYTVPGCCFPTGTFTYLFCIPQPYRPLREPILRRRHARFLYRGPWLPCSTCLSWGTCCVLVATLCRCADIYRSLLPRKLKSLTSKIGTRIGSVNREPVESVAKTYIPHRFAENKGTPRMPCRTPSRHVVGRQSPVVHTTCALRSNITCRSTSGASTRGG